ncbi:thiol-disulfide oxidoreductase ResA [Evansella clarkii]|uniref:thiol-disulfide oxidoreductase ResA n=1 Tax=Evansella clarkii TaxID=79879 RepID=UPI0009986F0E|nr:thiol-disulfide oxidoreductase ResA [Evansella clarkii]
MKQKRLIIRSVILLIMIGAVSYTFYSHYAEERGVVDQGDIAPNFRVQDPAGNILELEELRGNGVYVNFWATYCSFCRDKMKYMNEHYKEYEKLGVEVVNVNVDESTLRVERHQERHQLDFPLYIDRDMLVSNAYGVASLPTTFLIDENGNVIERQIGAKTEAQVIESFDRLIPGGN